MAGICSTAPPSRAAVNDAVVDAAFTVQIDDGAAAAREGHAGNRDRPTAAL
ncbi:MAG: hypothetical protein ACLSGS_09890 [Adlercreutzia sp.]